MTDLLVMVPTRGRPEKCARILKSFSETTVLTTTDILFITDGDDNSYKDMDWGEAQHGILSPREALTGKLNHTAKACTAQYDALMFAGDDHVFNTPGWDDIMLRMLADMGGTGMVYPDDKRRQDVPEIIMISSDIVEILEHFAEPSLKHYYIDNAWAELGKRSGLIQFCREAVITHHHYSVDADTDHDETYVQAERAWGESDLRAFHNWRANIMPVEVSKLRRNFNPDVSWVLGRI
jgi:hypothetical protein